MSLRTRLANHMSDLERLADEARRSGSARARLTDCLFVNVVDSQLASEMYARGVKQRALVENPFAQSSDSYVADSLQFYTHFSRNVAPYSVFPLTVDNRFAIATGSLWVVSCFSFGNLVRCLRRRHLYVRPPDPKGFEELKDLPPGEVAKRELDNPFIVSRGPPGPVLQTPFSGLTRLLYEFLDEESFADAVEEKLELATSENSPAFIHDSFQCEAELWD